MKQLTKILKWVGVNVFLIYLWPLEGLKQIKANRLILFTYELIRYNLNHDM